MLRVNEDRSSRTPVGVSRTFAAIARSLPGLLAAALLASACTGPEPTFVDAAIDADPNDDAIDSIPPETTLTVTPGDPSNQAPARFEFVADKSSTFECRLDDGGWTTCSSPHDQDVTEGSHAFEVRAISLAPTSLPPTTSGGST